MTVWPVANWASEPLSVFGRLVTVVGLTSSEGPVMFTVALFGLSLPRQLPRTAVTA